MMPIEHNREKLINAILYFLKHTQICGKTKLLKLLYFLDFLHFKETGKSVTGLDYYAWEFGPVPNDLYEEMNKPRHDLEESVFIPQGKSDKKFIEFKPKKKFDDKYFTKRELRILKNVADIFKEANADQMVESTHLPNHPWDRTLMKEGKFAKINYMLALDNSPQSISPEEALERIRDREEIKRAFAR